MSLRTPQGQYLRTDGDRVVVGDKPAAFEITKHGDKISLRAPNRKFLAAEPGGVVKADRDAASTDPGSWELFTQQGSAFRAHNDRFLTVNGGNLEATATSAFNFTVEPFSGGSVAGALQGQVRQIQGSYGDATGPRRILFCSLFPAPYLYVHERALFEEALDEMVEYGWLGYRFFGAVGNREYWRDREISPEDYTQNGEVIQALPNYDDAIRGVLQATHDRGLKVHITAGDLQVVLPHQHQRIAYAERMARLVNDVTPEVCALFEALNEGFQNGVGDDDAGARSLLEMTRSFSRICPQPLTALTCGASGEEPESLYRFSIGSPVCTIHGARDVRMAAGRAFGVVYWDGTIRHFWKDTGRALWQGEMTGEGAYMQITDPGELMVLYAATQATGQASVYLNGVAVRYGSPNSQGHDTQPPLSSNWGFQNIPRLMSFIPEDIGQWPNMSHGNKTTTPIGAHAFQATHGTGPDRVDMVWNDSKIVAWVRGGSGVWNLITRRNMNWQIIAPDGIESEGSGPLPSLDSAGGPRMILGDFT